MQPIPSTLAPFFQEYDLAGLDLERDRATVIERTLQFGNRLELRWLFARYPASQITDWVRQFGKDRLPNPHRTFWQILLGIEE